MIIQEKFAKRINDNYYKKEKRTSYKRAFYDVIKEHTTNQLRMEVADMKFQRIPIGTQLTLM